MANAAGMLLAALALSAMMTFAAPAFAKTAGDTALYVEQSKQDGRDAHPSDGQQHETTTSSGGSLAQTGDPGARGAAALALVGGSLTAIGSAAKRRKGRLVPVSPKTAGARAAHLS